MNKMSEEICSTCGLPKEICVCEEITKEKQEITVKIETKRYGKAMTVLEGFSPGINLESLASDLKKKLACGGTYDEKRRRIELQGNHTHKIKNILTKMNYSEEQINVK